MAVSATQGDQWAARGELRRALPIGLVRGEGEVRFHPDATVVGVIRTVFQRFAELGSLRRVWLWPRSQELPFPAQLKTTGPKIDRPISS